VDRLATQSPAFHKRRSSNKADYNKLVQAWFPQPRWKRYAAQSGWIYEYIFEGLPAEGEYHFRATSGPANNIAITVLLDAACLAQWGAANRPLTPVESYGIAKLALLRALDESASPATVSHVRPTFQVIAEICAELDL